MAKHTKITPILFCLFLLAQQSGFSQQPVRAEVSVSIISDTGQRIHLAPGEPSPSMAQSITVTVLPETPCYLYAIFSPRDGQSPAMLWPSPLVRAVEQLPQNRITELDFDSRTSQISFTEGTLTVLLLTTFPVELHTALTGKKSDQGRILREIRTLFQRHSAYADKQEKEMVLIAGNVRSDQNTPQGIRVDRDTFWGGVYEWAALGE